MNTRVNEASPSGGAGRYSLVAMLLHWLLAVMIALNFVGAWLAEDVPKAEKMQMMAGHKAMGITILLLTVLRILWRVTKRPPALLDSLKAWEIALARVTHALFYFLLLAIPLAGWALHSAASGGAPVQVFGLFAMPPLPVGSDAASRDIFHELHEAFATLMLFLMAMHVAAAFKHVLIDRDGTMRRMLPWG